MIKQIVFDMGNVLVRFDPEYFMDREGINDPAEREWIRKEMFHSIEWAQMDRGDLTEETAEPLILSRLPESLRDQARRLLYHWADAKDGIPGMEDLVRRLKTAGYGIYLLSNASVAQHRYWPQYPVSVYMDGKLISADVKRVKPMDEIYQLFMEKFSLKAEECVFIDDLPANVAGAIGNGMHGIVFDGDAAKLETKLAKIGVVTAPEEKEKKC